MAAEYDGQGIRKGVTINVMWGGDINRDKVGIHGTGTEAGIMFGSLGLQDLVPCQKYPNKDT